MPLPLLLAPILGKLAESGLTMLASAVTAKGKEVVEQTLGVDLDKELQTEEGKLKLRQLEIDHEEFLVSAAQKDAEIRLKDKELDVQSTANAQTMNTKIQESDHASRIAKEGPYYLDFLIVGATLILAYVLLFQGVPVVNKELFYTAFGALLAMCSTILNFHRGTSASSARANDFIRSTFGGNPK